MSFGHQSSFSFFSSQKDADAANSERLKKKKKKKNKGGNTNWKSLDTFEIDDHTLVFGTSSSSSLLSPTPAHKSKAKKKEEEEFNRLIKEFAEMDKLAAQKQDPAPVHENVMSRKEKRMNKKKK